MKLNTPQEHILFTTILRGERMGKGGGRETDGSDVEAINETRVRHERTSCDVHVIAHAVNSHRLAVCRLRCDARNLPRLKTRSSRIFN